MTRSRFVLAVAALLALGGCDPLGPGTDGLEELEQSRAKWRRQGLTSYSYVLRRSCFCGWEATQPVRIVVENGVRQSVTYVATGEPVVEPWLASFPTMEGLFDVLADAYRRADRVEVSYDVQRGFPVRAEIDYMTRAIDDELAFDVSSVNHAQE